MADVSNKLLGQFVACLESKIGANPGADATAPAEAPASAETPAAPPADGVRKIESAEAEPVDLLGAAGAPVLKRIVPVVAAAVVAYVVFRLVRR